MNIRPVRLVLLFLCLVIAPESLLQGQSYSDTPPSTLASPAPNNMAGAAPFSTVEQSAHEQINLANGSLNFFLPIASFPQKAGRSLQLALVYSSNETYSLKETDHVMGDSCPGAERYCFLLLNSARVEWVANRHGPWYSSIHVNVPTLSADMLYTGNNRQPLGNNYYEDNPTRCLQNWVFTDWSGTAHSFKGYRDCDTNASFMQVSGSYALTIGNAQDGSGYQLDARSTSDPIIRGPDGVIYHFPAQPEQSTSWSSGDTAQTYNAYAFVASNIIDPNHNQITIARQSNGTYLLTDTMGRQVTFAETSFSWSQQESLGHNPVQLSATASEHYSANVVSAPFSPLDSCVANPEQRPDGSTAQVFFDPNLTVPDGTTWTITLQDGSAYVLSMNALDEISKIRYPAGGYTRYEYAVASNSGQKNQGDLLCTQSWRSVFAKHECSLSSGGCTETPAVSDPTACVPGMSGGEATSCYWGFASSYNWGTLQVRNPRGERTDHQFYYAAGPQLDGRYFNPIETGTAFYDSTGILLRTVSSTVTSGRDNNYPVPYAITTTLADTSPTLSSTVTTTYWLPGQVQTSTETDFNGNIIRSVANYYKSTGIYADTDESVGSSALTHVLDHLSSSTVTESVTNKTVTVSNTYDDTQGNLVQVDRSATNAAGVTTKYHRDSEGNISETFDPMQVAAQHAGSTAMRYDSQSIPGCPQNPGPGLPTSVTNALNQTTLYAYYDSGLKACVQDANGQVTRMSYEPLGRPSQIDYPDQGQLNADYTSSPPLTETTTVHQDRYNSPSRETILDGFGRVTQHILLTAPEGSTCTETFYDSVGNVYSTNYPRLGCLGSVAQGASRTYEYDALGRRTKLTNEDGTSAHWVYSGATVDMFDELGKHHHQQLDAFGRLTDAYEPDQANNPTLHTSYAYDGFGNLLAATQAGTQGDAPRRRSFNYDGLSRLLCSSNPESNHDGAGQQIACPTDASSPLPAGASSYTYNLNGSLLTTGNANGLVASLSYDALDRVLAKSFSDGTPSACFQYDVPAAGSSVSNVIGRLAAEWTQPGACGWQGEIPATSITWRKVTNYDPMGRISSELQCAFAPCALATSGVPANPIQYSYDYSGGLSLSSNGVPPSGSPGMVFTYMRDGAGRLSKVTNMGAAASEPADLFVADGTITNAYGPQGLLNARIGISSSTLQPVVSQTRSYDARGRLSSMTTTPGAGNSSSTSNATLALGFASLTQGVALPFTSTCTACGSGTGGANVSVDGVYIEGFNYDAGMVSTGRVPTDNLGLGWHSVVIDYIADSTHTHATTNAVPFQITSTPLPHPTISARFDPIQIPEGESADILITASCGSQCSQGVQLYIDGLYAGGSDLDENGEGSGATPVTLTQGHHDLVVHYFGGPSYAATDSAPIGFDVIPDNLPELPISTQIYPSAVPQDEYGVVTVTEQCGSGCRGSHFYVDDQYAGGFIADGSNASTIYIPRNLSVGPHRLAIQYFGDAMFRPTTASTSFQVVADNLPIPTITAVPNSNPVPANQFNLVSISVTAASQGASECDGFGQLFVEGQYRGTFSPDPNGLATLYIQPLPPGDHTLTVSYYGSATCHPRDSDPISFLVQ